MSTSFAACAHQGEVRFADDASMASEPPEIHAAALCSLNGMAMSDSPAISLIPLCGRG
jgi:hypothetical protein